MSTLREAAQQALEALGFSCPAPHLMSKHDAAEAALRAALAQEQEEGRMEFNVKETVCAKCGSTNGAHSHDCPGAKAALAQQEQATVKESLPVGQEEPEGGWQSAPSPQVTQRIADMPMSEYRRGVNDGFKLGLREGRIKAEDEMREQPEQEPVAWIQPDHLQKARVAPFLCRVEPTKRCSDFVPIYTAPPAAERAEPVAWVNAAHLQGLTLGHYVYVEISTGEAQGRVPLYTHPPRRETEQEPELRRLHAVNAELLEALKIARPYVSAALTDTGSADAYHAERQVDIAIARAEGKQT